MVRLRQSYIAYVEHVVLIPPSKPRNSRCNFRFFKRRGDVIVVEFLVGRCQQEI